MPSKMSAALPPGRPSVRRAYEAWAASHTAVDGVAPSPENAPDPAGLSVGIVGGGMAGLYAALLLQLRGVDVHVYEANPTRLGGRVYTHRFNEEPNQYFEAGAMRLPEIPEQQPVFDLIGYLNTKVPTEEQIELIPYILYDDSGNLCYVNGELGPDGQPMSVAYAGEHPEALGFSAAATGGLTAQALLDSAIKPFLDLLEDDFEKGFTELVKYDDLSFRAYLAMVLGWTEERINYVEVMTSQTNQFQSSFTELVIESMDFSQAHWKSIKNGMDRLPNALASVVGSENISMGARVVSIDGTQSGGSTISFADGRSVEHDRVIMALPPAALRMIETPQWTPSKNHAIRALHFEPLYKIGMRFTSRFWERVGAPSNGGQSITDLPSRWFVYPSYGIGDEGEGVLLLYSWMTDAVAWLPQPMDQRIDFALRDLQTVYEGQVDVREEFIEAFTVNWTVEESTGDAMFFPGQFKNLFNIARVPEGNVYFAGEHLSVHHTWIVGALDSALLAVQQLLGAPDVEPVGHSGGDHEYDYTDVVAAARAARHGEA
ncbi:MAG: NAD(P)/FAD-dependent oxidoreductase [Actinomycetota bacterium]